MPIFVARWPDRTCSLTVAESCQDARLAFNRLAPVDCATITQLPPAAAPGAGLVLHFQPTRQGVQLELHPGDQGVVVDGHLVAGQDALTVLQAVPAPPRLALPGTVRLHRLAVPGRVH